MAHTATALTTRELKCPEQRLVHQWEDLSAHMEVSGIYIARVYRCKVLFSLRWSEIFIYDIFHILSV